MVFKDPINADEVEIVVGRALESTVKVVSYSIKVYSDEYLGFLGAHRQLIVLIQRQGYTEHETYTFFLKCVPYDNDQQASLIKENNVFYKETSFYKHILPLLASGVKDTSYVAQCYLVKDDILVFENLKSRNFSLKGQLLNVFALKSVMTEVAKFHASTILAEKQLGKAFQELYPEAFEECMFVRKGKFYKWYTTGVDVLVAVTKYLNLDDTCIPQICNRIFDMILSSKIRRNVICHGDLKSYNLLFDNSEPIPKCVMVDFQLLRYAPPTLDIAQLFYLSTRRELREKNEKELLRYYYDGFCKILRENDKEIKTPAFDEILEEYEEMRVVGMITVAVYSPLIFLEAETCAELIKDSDTFAKLAFEDRADLILSIMKKDSLYNDIISEIVTEMVEKSKQFLTS